MSGSSKDSDTNARSGHDRSLQTLLVVLAVTGTIATSMIVIAFATTPGGQTSPDEMGTPTTSVTEPEPEEEEIRQAVVVDNRPLQPDKEETGLTGYIDSLLANNANYEKNSSKQARLVDTAALPDSLESEPADESSTGDRPLGPAHGQTAPELDDATKSDDTAGSESTKEEATKEESIDEPADNASESADTAEPEDAEKADDDDHSSQPSDDVSGSESADEEQADEEETVLQAIVEMLPQFS